ncbi:MAG: cytochrome c oxidase subunit II [Acidimicrobiia bacterium]|nr:cytochrome c oxidase subunit II [Acidimicrobiia bacterium]
MTVVQRLRKLWFVVAVALLLTACADDKPLNTFEPRGPQARTINDLMYPYVWGIMGVVFVIVVFGGIYLSIKNRVNGDELDPNDLPSQIHGNTRVELTWTIVPTLILAVVFIPVMNAVWELEKPNEANELDVMVIGQQWWWEYRYDVDGDGFIIDGNGDGMIDDNDWELPVELILDPDDVVTANELVIPAGEQVDLILTSRDVIHSFWIPRLNGKRDTVPGRWHTWSLEADEPGKYTGWCTEYCGLSHARMRMSTIALTDADFTAWLENQTRPAEVPTDPEAVAGRETFQNQCMSCHLINDGELEYPDNFAETVPLVSRAAPNLTHFATRTTFAGGIYANYAGPGTDANDDAFDVADYLNIAELAANPTTTEDYRWNTAELKRWVQNAPERKAMASEVNPETGLGRGMLPFPQLSDEELDQIVAYLATLD